MVPNPDCTATGPALVSECCFLVRVFVHCGYGTSANSEHQSVWKFWVKRYGNLRELSHAKIRRRFNVTLYAQFLVGCNFSWRSQIMVVILPSHARFEIFRAVYWRIQFFCDVTLYHWVSGSRVSKDRSAFVLKSKQFQGEVLDYLIMVLRSFEISGMTYGRITGKHFILHPNILEINVPVV
jgi:hypothetical protein